MTCPRAHASPRRRREVIDALRRGTVPVSGLDLLAVGLERFVLAADTDLDAVAGGGSAFKAVRGEYGAGKTFFARFLAERALRRGFAAAEVQISETQSPSQAHAPSRTAGLRWSDSYGGLRRRPRNCAARSPACRPSRTTTMATPADFAERGGQRLTSGLTETSGRA